MEEASTVAKTFPIELFNDKIAIRRDDREEMSEGGLVLPTGSQPRSMTGTVVAVGPGMLRGDDSRVQMPVEVGDIVVFEQFRHMIPIEVTFGDGNKEVFHIMGANDILGKAISEVKIRGKA
jgi:co-chaperonin GroES (HSP10)